jgi:phospholipid/cholesterol/gamma-HCH transport system ATP-binding protein
MTEPDAHITIQGLTMAFGDAVVQRDLDFVIPRGSIFVIMGDSGSGKSTLLRHMLGLERPAAGTIRFGEQDMWSATQEQRNQLLRRAGVLYQSGALWSSMTLAENIGLPLGQYTDLGEAEIRELAAYKLALVGLAGFEDYNPGEISGGMRKRAALARAIALDPEVLFFDEPSAGLDPITARLLDDLILELRDSLEATIVMVTHELASIFAVGDLAVFLDGEAKTMTALGPPKDLLADPPNEKVGRFLTRGEGPPHSGPARTT